VSRKEIAAIAGIIAVAEAILLFCIPAFWHAGVSMSHVVGAVILNSFWVTGFVSWIMALFLLVILAIFGVLIVILGFRAIVGLLAQIAAALRDLAVKFDTLSSEMSEKARDAAIDAGFLAVIGIASALVAYVSTEDFLAKIAVLKILAVASMCYAVLKATMLIPIRSTQILSAVLMTGILAGTTVLLHHKHPLYPLSEPRGVARWFVRAEMTQITAACAIVVLSALSICYPFTWRAWKKRILSIS
jgi:hypothetical protein